MHRLLAFKRDGSIETHIITFQWFSMLMALWRLSWCHPPRPLERAMKAYCSVFLGLEYEISQATLQEQLTSLWLSFMPFIGEFYKLER